MEKLKALFGFSAKEDPLKREVEEMRRAAKAAVKTAERVGKRVGKAGRGRGSGSAKGSKAEEDGGLRMVVEEMDSIFAGLEQL